MLGMVIELNKNGLRVELTVTVAGLIAVGGTLLAIIAKLANLF